MVRDVHQGTCTLPHRFFAAKSRVSAELSLEVTRPVAMPQPVAFDLKFETRLEVEPEPLRCAEEPRQTQGGVGGHRSLAVHDLIDPAGRHTEALRQTVLRQTKRLEKIFPQHLTRVHRPQPLPGHGLLLVVINDFDIMRIALLPSKTDPPLIVDANAVLPHSITGELLESVTRRHAQVLQRGGRVELDQFSQRDTMDRLRQLPDGLPVEEALGILVP